MRRRRRSGGTWLPQPGTEVNDTILSAGIASTTTVPANGDAVCTVTALTFDEPSEGADVSRSLPLVSLVGDEYFLKRIVGKYHAFISPSEVNGGDVANHTAAVLVTAGFFVARAGDFQDDNSIPIGGLAALVRDYSPDQPNVIREPWIWRRSWLLGNAMQAREQERGGGWVPGHQLASALPFSTGQYGSVADGPHIDAKTKRRVAQDQRLFFIVDVKNFPLGNDLNVGSTLRWHLDYRLFASLRKARNRGVF